MKSFEVEYKKLNSAQKRAVDLVEGPVMVVAGPGTGKTAILTLRIANILKKTDTEPGNILALTFTESGASNMRRRLSEIIGTPAYSVAIGTFHGFCNDIIKQYPDEFGRIIGSTSITEVDQIRILKDIISRLSLKELKPFGDTFYYLRAMLNAINQLKREGVDDSEFEKAVKQEGVDFESINDLYHEKGAHKGKMKGEYQTLLKQIKKNEELVKIYKEYQKGLAKEKLYDYSDMIMEVLRELKVNPDLLLMLQEKHQYVLVDEHQDTNTAQNKILELLCNFHPNPNLFIVGDEKQAIFRFQGASLENFNYFKKLYPKAELVHLTDNYRSTQSILDIAHSLLAGDAKLKSAATDKSKGITLFSFSKPDIENYFLAQDIESKLKAGVKAEEVAILYRDNRDAFPIAKALEKRGLPLVIESDQNILEDHDVKKLILLLDVVHNFGQDQSLLNAMHIDFLNIDPLDLYKVAHHSNKERISVFDILRSNPILESLNLESSEVIQALYKNLTEWKRFSENHSLPEFFEKIVRESGFLTYILAQPDAVEKLDKLNAFFDELQSLIEVHKNYKLKDFFDYLEILREQNVNIKHKLIGHGTGRVRLMTAHKSKGQEFEHVYIINVYDGHWGNKRRPNLIKLPSQIFSIAGVKLSEMNDIDDERRLFYVAITRAKKSVTVTYAQSGADGREQLASQFISEIDEKLLSTGDAKTYETKFSKSKDMLFAPSKKVHTDIKSKEFIQSVFMERGLNVSALNNYLECPWKYFYTNLLRIPRPQEKHQMYGTAIHAALKDFFDELNEGQASKQLLLDKFNHYLNRQSMTEVELKDYSDRGLAALGGYYDNYYSSWSSKVLSEFGIKGVILTPEIRLTGQIDKMELGNNNQVNVVDYKTGKPKSRNLIDGKTKNADGNIKRQLVFYNLLLNKYEDGKKFKMVSGDIDFVEPDEKGRYHKENFVIDKEEVNELESTIHTVAKEIINLEFWDRACDERDCEFCALRRMMVSV